MTPQILRVVGVILCCCLKYTHSLFFPSHKYLSSSPFVFVCSQLCSFRKHAFAVGENSGECIR
ncbi:unnamed protein product [Meloidogyne enterolobii]|uniref:Uncharacterized protein n=1 Tax=Meloidogyne enterolobii TaxID=390850 RepID=A0ACB0Y8A3_MELEN